MDNLDLRLYFPNALLKETIATGDEYLSVPYQGKYLWIASHELTDKERSLIAALRPEKPEQNALRNHVWYPILFEGARLVKAGKSFRILQINLTFLEELQNYKKLWQESLLEFFPSYVDGFFLTDSEYILVEELSQHNYEVSDLKGIFTTLDDDFSIESIVFVGEFYQDNEAIFPLFQEERRLFSEAIAFETDNRVFRFSDVALNYFTREKIAESSIAHYFREKLAQEDEAFRQLVQKMWEFSGNITSVAKAMYTHRNTINYRVERIYEHTGINLKNPNDLILVYLITN